MNGRLLLLVALALLTQACATTPKLARPEVPNGEQCLALYAKVDAQIAAAGVQDGGYARIPDFPYLRSDRFSASFAQEFLKEPTDMDAFWEWVGYLRANEDEARDIELRNLIASETERTSLLLDLRGCGGWLRSWELDDAAYRKHLLSQIMPPDEYSGTARALGLYPLARPFLRLGVAGYQADVRADYARPLDQLDAPGPLTLWQVQRPEEMADATIDLRTKPRDRLGRIGMLGSEIEQLAHRHAPALWIETAGDYDRPGAPVLKDGKPGVDTARPIVYYLPGYTRFGGRNLLQMSYFVWFSERPARGAFDSAAGTLDGVIWRVTLDEQGRPLFHDTIHACGCYHYAFGTPGLKVREQDADQDPILLPQPEGAPTDRVAVRLASGTHYVRRVVAPEQAVAAQRSAYTLRPYDDLSTLPIENGRTRSLFGEDGMVAGTERSERLWLWPSGVRNAGAMRQWGRHATAFIGERHFDDPFLFESVFEPPAVAEAAAP
jgi:hypothetical protein